MHGPIMKDESEYDWSIWLIIALVVFVIGEFIYGCYETILRLIGQ